MKTLGIDTSNYATSLVVFDTDEHSVAAHIKLPLRIEDGKLGLRQRDAVFAHILNLPGAFAQLAEQTPLGDIIAIGVSDRPRDTTGSYMPCFLSGVAVARSIGSVLSVPVYTFSHQAGHLMAALYGTDLSDRDRLDFLALHASGGTTDSMVCRLDGAGLDIKTRGTSLDLFAGQAVDRVGAMLGLPFPAGPELSALAAQSDTSDAAKAVIKGVDCCLSGLQNQCEKLLAQGREHPYIARYCLNSIAAVIAAMTDAILLGHEALDIIYAGGVLSSDIIRPFLQSRFDRARFCQPAWLSADNAVGVALLAARKEGTR